MPATPVRREAGRQNCARGHAPMPAASPLPGKPRAPVNGPPTTLDPLILCFCRAVRTFLSIVNGSNRDHFRFTGGSTHRPCLEHKLEPCQPVQVVHAENAGKVRQRSRYRNEFARRFRGFPRGPFNEHHPSRAAEIGQHRYVGVVKTGFPVFLIWSISL